MLGLFGTLNLGTRSLQAQRQGVETAGQNLANVNNPAYARQRVQIQTSITLPTAIGPQGTGVDAVAIQQLRDRLVDQQIVGEQSEGGLLELRQRAFEYAQAALGEQIDRNSASASAGDTANQGATSLSGELGELFSAFQSLSTSPAATFERQVLLGKAQTLATRFHQVDERIDEVAASMNESIETDLADANQLLSELARLNRQIVTQEFNGAVANDLRDLRQQRLEDLAKIVNITVAPDNNGAVNVSIGGQLLVAGETVLDTLEKYDAGGGQQLVRTATGDTPLTLAGGSLQGAISARDGELATLRGRLDSLASLLISEVNQIHVTGYALDGTNDSARVFFTGTDAASIGVNQTLLDNPSLVQASSRASASGDNGIALALAQLADKRHPSLGNQTFVEGYSHAVAELGHALDSVNDQVSNHQALAAMLKRQRDSVSGVSLDEEMTELMKYQKAFDASARLVTTVDEMLDTVLNLKR